MRDFSSRQLVAMALLVFLASYVLVTQHYAVAADATHSPDTCAICSWAAAFAVIALALPTVESLFLVTHAAYRGLPLFRLTFAAVGSQPRAPPRVRSN